MRSKAVFKLWIINIIYDQHNQLTILANLQDTVSVCKNQFYYYIPAINNQELKLRKKVSFTKHQKHKIGINLTKDM